MKKAIRVYIFGTVQGVFFRSFIRDEAEKLEIKGYTRNKDDGSVEVWIEGNPDDVDKMVEICKKGPINSIIKNVDIIEERVQDMKEFKVLRI